MFYQAQMPLFKLQTFNIYFTLRLEKFNPRGLKSIQLALGGEGRSGTGIATPCPMDSSPIISTTG